MNPVLFAQRVAGGREYLETLAQPPWSEWDAGVAAFREGHLSVPQAVALAHPDWVPVTERERVQGVRRFPPPRQGSLARCEAARIWGYKCTLDDATAEVDHLFPYSLGGPTIAANRLILCSTHNAGKAGDVHLYPWEEGVPGWLALLVERLERARRS